MLTRIFKAIAASALLLASSAAVGQSAAPLSVASSPAAAAYQGSGEAGELRGRGRWIIGAIVLGLIIWGAFELFDKGEPDSP